MSEDLIQFEIAEQVALLTLNRPKALNALNQALLSELADALGKADSDPAVRAIVVAGSEKAFAAGADIKEMSSKTYAEVSDMDMFAFVDHAFAACRKPVIAAVSGYALGGGCELAMLCDFIIASDTAKFGQPEINLGVMAGIGGTQRMTRSIGKAKAMDLHLTGRMMDAEEAERCGLVARIVPVDQLMDEAMKAAQVIAAKSTISTRMIKETVNRSFETSLDEGLLFERRNFHALFATEDQKEGMNAFSEKRPPAFKDR